MKIKLEFVGYLKIRGVENGSYVEVERGTTVADLLTNYDIDEEHQQYITPMINGKKIKLSYVLQANDNLFLLLPLGGG